jgi:hypothetical protein
MSLWPSIRRPPCLIYEIIPINFITASLFTYVESFLANVGLSSIRVGTIYSLLYMESKLKFTEFLKNIHVETICARHKN